MSPQEVRALAALYEAYNALSEAFERQGAGSAAEQARDAVDDAISALEGERLLAQPRATGPRIIARR